MADVVWMILFRRNKINVNLEDNEWCFRGYHLFLWNDFERVMEIMYGDIIETVWGKAEKLGREAGRAEGRMELLTSLFKRGLISKEVAIAESGLVESELDAVFHK